MKDETKSRRNLANDVGLAMLNVWDPIGVSSIPEAHDEYDNYVPRVLDLLYRGDKEQLFHYLWQVETQHIGLVGNRRATRQFVDYLLRLKETSSNSMSEGSESGYSSK